MKLRAALLFSSLLGVSTAVGSSPTLRMSPQQAFEPATVRATVTLEPNYLNQVLCLSWDSQDGEMGQNCRTLDGQYEPKTRTYEVKLSAGQYLFQASVERGPQWLFSARVPVSVLSKQ